MSARVIAHDFPLLIANRQKKQYTWKITAYTDGYSVSHGYLGGKIQTSDTDISAGKVNRTSAEQSILEAKSKYNQKVTSGYSPKTETLKTAKKFSAKEITESKEQDTSPPPASGSFVNHTHGTTVYYPMLCKIFTDSKQNVVYPCFTQRKIDGVRALARLSEGTVTLQSRNGKFYNLPVIQAILKTFFELNRIPEGWILDGELHTIDPTKYSFDRISGICRRGLKAGAIIGDGEMRNIQYQIYDIAPGSPEQEQVPFSQRYKLYSSFAVTSQNIALVPCSVGISEEDIFRELEVMIEQGHEGVIIRNAAGVYHFGPARSNDIQKLKRFTDSEYQLCGFKEGKGKNKGMPVLICRLPDSSATFKATPDGPAASRMNMLTYLKGLSDAEVCSQIVTVKYQELTPAGVPRFPIAVGTSFRNQYE